MSLRGTSPTSRSSISRSTSPGDQLAPFGFLIVQRALVRILGDSNYALRLVP